MEFWLWEKNPESCTNPLMLFCLAIYCPLGVTKYTCSLKNDGLYDVYISVSIISWQRHHMLVCVAGSVRVLMGSHWQWNAPCLQVRGPPTPPIPQTDLLTLYTDGIKHVWTAGTSQGDLMSAHCVPKTTVVNVPSKQMNRYCLWTSW